MAKRNADEQITKEVPFPAADYKPQPTPELEKVREAPLDPEEEVSKRKLFRSTPPTNGDKKEEKPAAPSSIFGLFGTAKPEQPKPTLFSSGFFSGTAGFGNFMKPKTEKIDKEKYSGFFKSGEATANKPKEEDSEEEGEENPEEEKDEVKPHNLQGELAEPSSVSLKVKPVPLDPSPYSKLVSINVPKFKVEKASRGTGTVAIEKADTKSTTLMLLTFRNASGNLLFQGQLMKNVSKLLKHTNPKPYKIQRIVTVIEKKETGGFSVTRCLITFQHEKDCEEFRTKFKEAMENLPEIIKSVKVDKEKEEKVETEKKEDKKE